MADLSGGGNKLYNLFTGILQERLPAFALSQSNEYAIRDMLHIE